MADPNEQATQPQQPEQSPKRHTLGRKIAALALGVGAAIGIPAAVMHDNGEARPAPAPAPETPTATPTTPEASNGGESNEAMAAEFNKIKEPALASARTLLEKISTTATNTDDRLRISVDSSTTGEYSPHISAEATPEDRHITIEARGGEGDPGNHLSYTFKVNDEGIFADSKVTRDEFASALSDPSKVEVTDINVVDFDKNIVVGLHHIGEGMTERFNFDDGTPTEPNTPTFRMAAEIAEFNKVTMVPAMNASTERFAQ